MQAQIFNLNDARWAPLTEPLQDYLSAAARSWDEIFSWAEEAGWGDGIAARERGTSHGRLHLVRNAVAWLEFHGLAVWSWARKRWRAAKSHALLSSPSPSPPSAAPSPRKQLPALYHRTCHTCRRSFFSRQQGAGLCAECRPAGCALCSAPLPPEPVEDRFCSATHAARSRCSKSRPNHYTCALPECGIGFWGASRPSADRYCCSAHRVRAWHRQQRAQRPPRQGSLSPAAVSRAVHLIDCLGWSKAATARQLGVSRSTLYRRLKELPA